MKLWQQLYAVIWLAFLQIIILVVFGFVPYIIGLHIVLGAVILGLTQYNNAKMRKTQAPDRLKRIVRATATLATIQVVLGILLYAVDFYFNAIFYVDLIIRFIHVTIALAIITQASSVATAYDMWEEHEYSPATQSSATPVSARILEIYPLNVEYG